MDYTKAAAGFGLLADPNRLRILIQLSQGVEQSASQLLDALPVSQPTLSHHMKFLCEGGLVQRRRLGQRILYRLDQAALEQLLAIPLGKEAPPPAAQPAPPPVIVRAGHKW